MKTCPYCAEEIQDAAIRCRYCQSWLVDEIPAGADTPPAGGVFNEPKPAEVWAAPEPSTAAAVTTAVVIPAVVTPAVEPEAASAAESSAVVPSATSTSQPVPADQKVEFTHSGERYLLGYTESFFGIWDRQSPAAPSERFPRTDDGWRDVWQRYVAIETNWMDLRTGQRSP
jgi:hypothetical protein